LGIKNDGSTHGPHLCWKPEYMDEMSHSKGAIATPLYVHPTQPEQKPVAWSVFNKRTKKHWYTNDSKYTTQHYANEYSHLEPEGSPSMIVVPLYTTPPKPEWVSLTDDEIMQMYCEPRSDREMLEFAREFEAKLKEKNNVRWSF
jgi:hypothetical protein